MVDELEFRNLAGTALDSLMQHLIAREEDEAERAAQATANAAPEPAPTSQNPHTSLWQRLTQLFRGKK